MSTWSLSRHILPVIVLALIIPAASGWTLSSWSVNPSDSGLPPDKAVTASYTMYFDSWMTGTTFENDNSLTMYTDLVDPRWTVTRVEEMDGDKPLKEDLPVRQSQYVRLDGWSLSYSSKQFNVQVQLSGKTPLLNESGTITLVRLQEQTPDAKIVKSSTIEKKVQIIVPTTEPTPEETVPVTINMTPAEYIEITPETTTPAAPSVPSEKVTYSPGPGPALVAGALAGLVVIVRLAGRKK